MEKLTFSFNSIRKACCVNYSECEVALSSYTQWDFILFFLPPSVKFVIPWAEVTRLERVSTALMPEAIRVTTRQRQREFSMFLNLDEAFGVIGQLADIALRRLLDSKGLELDRVLQQPARITKRSVPVQVCANNTNRQ